MTESSRKLVYTCVFAGYDDLRPPRVQSPDIDFVCITDDPSLSVPGWETRVLDVAAEGLEDLDSTRQSRYAKILPHRLFPDYCASLYVDSNLELISPLEGIFANLEEHDIVFYRHPEGRANVYDEADACIRLNKDDPSCIKAHAARYRAAGFEGKSDPRFPTIPTAMVILRKHGKSDVLETMEFWWQEYLGGSRRDQMSLPYVLHSSGQPHALLDANVRHNEYFDWRPHDSVQATRDARKLYAGADALVLHPAEVNLDWFKIAVEAGRNAARGPLVRLRAKLGRRVGGRKIVFGAVPRNGKLSKQSGAEWAKTLGVAGCPIAYVRRESATPDNRFDEARFMEILSEHDAPTLIESFENLRAGRTARFLNWCKQARVSIDADVLTAEVGEAGD